MERVPENRFKRCENSKNLVRKRVLALIAHCLSYPRHEYGASDEQEHAVSERQGWTKGRPE